MSTTTIEATLQAVSTYTTGLESRFANLDIEVRTGVVLAVQELCVNIVTHAYAGKDGVIHIQLNDSEHQLQFIISDHAPNSFDPPDEIAEPDPLDLPEGGLGLFIIYQTFDKVLYERHTDGNRWVLDKKLEG